MDQKQKRPFDVRIIVGLLVLAAGILLLLDNLDIGFHVRIGDYWPVILIILGLGKILQPRGYRQVYWGSIITAIGALFLLNNLGYFHFRFHDLWPFLIILLGIEILRCGFFGHKIKARCCTFNDKGKAHFEKWTHNPDSHQVDNDFIDISVVLGGGDYTFTNKKLKGGQVSAIMGGCEIDLRNADMEPDQMVLDTSAIMGGIDIRVPTHWEVVLQASPILGGMEDKTAKPQNPSKKLIINGSAIMGAIEVKN